MKFNCLTVFAIVYFIGFVTMLRVFAYRGKVKDSVEVIARFTIALIWPIVVVWAFLRGIYIARTGRG